jgi:hypothetical protein
VAEPTKVGGLTVKRISKDGVVEAWNQANEIKVKPGDSITKVNGASGDFALMMEELRTARDLRITITRRKDLPGVALTGGCQGALATGTAPTKNSRPAPGLGDMGGGPPMPTRLANTPAYPAAPVGTAGEQESLALQTARALMGGGHSPAENHLLRFDVQLEKRQGARLGIDVMLVTGNGLCGLIVERVADGGAVDAWNQRSREPHRVQAGDCIIKVNDIGTGHSIARMAEEFTKLSRSVRFTIQRVLQEGVTAPWDAAVEAGLLSDMAKAPEGTPAFGGAGIEQGSTQGSQVRIHEEQQAAIAAAAMKETQRLAPLADGSTVLEARPNRGRGATTVAPIGAGRGGGAPSAPGFDGNVGRNASSQELINSILLLEDAEAVMLLREAMAQRPWLKSSIELGMAGTGEDAEQNSSKADESEDEAEGADAEISAQFAVQHQ